MADANISAFAPLIRPYDPTAINQANQNLLNSQKEGQSLDISNEQNQSNLNNGAAANVAKSAFSLLSLPADQRVGQAGYDNLVQEANAQLLRNNTPAAQSAIKAYIANIAPPIGGDGTPTDYTARIAQHLLGSAAVSGPEAIKQIFGDSTTQATGGHILAGTQSSPLMGALNGTGSAFTPGSTTTMTPSVGDQMARTNVVDASLKPGTVPTTSLTPGLSTAPVVTPVNPLGSAAPGSAPPQAVAPPNNGPMVAPPPRVVGTPGSGPPPRLAGATGTTTPAATAAPPAPTGPPGFVQSGAGPGQTALPETSSVAYVNAQNQDSGYNSSQEALAHMQSLLKDSTTGGGAEALQQARNFLETNAQRLGLTKTTVDAATADELEKMFAQAVTKMAPGSDARMGAIAAGSMSMGKSSMANGDLIARLQMQSRLEHAGFQSFQASGGKPADFSTYINGFNNTNHPLAYYEFPPGGERTAMTKMTSAQLAQYVASRQQRAQIESGSLANQTTPPPSRQ